MRRPAAFEIRRRDVARRRRTPSRPVRCEKTQALALFANTLQGAGRHAEALPAREALLDGVTRGPYPESTVAVAMANLANCYEATGRDDEALALRDALDERRGDADDDETTATG